MTRPTKDEYFTRMAQLVATRSTCARRSVGCVLVNSRGHVLATGYNGVPAGRPHCNERSSAPGVAYLPNGIEVPAVIYPHACPSADAPSGTRLDECFAVHAEQNALLQCRDAFEIDTAYVTVAPCATCLKLLLNTSCRRLVLGGRYAPEHTEALERWWRLENGEKRAVEWVCSS